jgi:hypothetical protein
VVFSLVPLLCGILQALIYGYRAGIRRNHHVSCCHLCVSAGSGRQRRLPYRGVQP